MMSDQSSFSEILDCELDVSAGTDWSNDTAIRAQSAAHVFEQGDPQSCAVFLRDTSDRLSSVKDRRGQRRVTHPHTQCCMQPARALFQAPPIHTVGLTEFRNTEH